MRVAIVFMESKSSHNSKLEERQRMKIKNCAESLISVDLSTASENKTFFRVYLCLQREFQLLSDMILPALHCNMRESN